MWLDGGSYVVGFTVVANDSRDDLKKEAALSVQPLGGCEGCTHGAGNYYRCGCGGFLACLNFSICF